MANQEDVQILKNITMKIIAKSDFKPNSWLVQVLDQNSIDAIEQKAIQMGIPLLSSNPLRTYKDRRGNVHRSCNINMNIETFTGEKPNIYSQILVSELICEKWYYQKKCGLKFHVLSRYCTVQSPEEAFTSKLDTFLKTLED